MIERVGAVNMFLHLDSYYMNIKESGAGTCDWGEICATLSGIGPSFFR